MQIRQSELLENLTILASLEAKIKDHRTCLLDRLFLLLMWQKTSHAMIILKTRLKEWELYHIKLRLDSEIAGNAPSSPETDPDEFYENLNSTLAAIPMHGVKLNTGHLLLHVIASPDSIAGRVLQMYSVTADEVAAALAALPDDEEYSGEIRVRQDDSDNANTNAGEPRPSAKNRETVLDKYGKDITLEALQGRVDPVVGREREIGRLIQILGRRKKNNPILVGDAGVGKSAIVEGLAARIVSGCVPSQLKSKRLWSLDLASLVAGTKFRGEFEERIKALTDELARRDDIILFIDEIHTIMGTGSSQGSLDTANILKPALTGNGIRCIGATTLDEYRENIERDAALERRFQKIVVEQTGPGETLEILRRLKTHYEKYHNVVYTDEALRACVELTGRYVPGRNFPDKAVDAMDEAGSKACASGRTGSGKPVKITVAHIGEVITVMTGIPVEKVSKDERARLGAMQAHLDSVVVGQRDAVAKVSRSILRSRAGLKSPDKPIGVFLFAGPTGVGKTLLAKELSRWMFDRDDALIRVDMSEFSERHNISRMIGSPPGYVGYGEGGQLTEAVRRHPYSVVLFDEIEKAHPDVFNVMLQMFDEGHLTDGQGRKIDFRNTVIIMTSNVGSREVSQRGPAVGFNSAYKPQRETADRDSTYRAALARTFAPEFVNRIDDIVIFNKLSGEDIDRVIDLELAELGGRVSKLGYVLSVSEDARRDLAASGYDPRFGVRSIRRAILGRIEEPLARMIVEGEVRPGETIDIVGSAAGIELLVKAA